MEIYLFMSLLTIYQITGHSQDIKLPPLLSVPNLLAGSALHSSASDFSEPTSNPPPQEPAVSLEDNYPDPDRGSKRLPFSVESDHELSQKKLSGRKKISMDKYLDSDDGLDRAAPYDSNPGDFRPTDEPKQPETASTQTVEAETKTTVVPTNQDLINRSHQVAQTLARLLPTNKTENVKAAVPIMPMNPMAYQSNFQMRGLSQTMPMMNMQVPQSMPMMPAMSMNNRLPNSPLALQQKSSFQQIPPSQMQAIFASQHTNPKNFLMAQNQQFRPYINPGPQTGLMQALLSSNDPRVRGMMMQNGGVMFPQQQQFQFPMQQNRFFRNQFQPNGNYFIGFNQQIPKQKFMPMQFTTMKPKKTTTTVASTTTTTTEATTTSKLPDELSKLVSESLEDVPNEQLGPKENDDNPLVVQVENARKRKPTFIVKASIRKLTKEKLAKAEWLKSAAPTFCQDPILVTDDCEYHSPQKRWSFNTEDGTCYLYEDPCPGTKQNSFKNLPQCIATCWRQAHGKKRHDAKPKSLV